MNIAGRIVLSAAVAATTLAAIPADAGERRHGHRWHPSHHRSDSDLLAAGIVGLTLGALAAGAIGSGRDEPVYVNPYRHPRPQPDRGYVLEGPVDAPVEVIVEDVYEPAYEPWSRGWYRYCRERYRSFDPETGTYLGYDGREHFCEAG